MNGSRCFIVNVYSQGEITEKGELWKALKMSKRGFGEGLWCVVGDFNVVRSSSERRGISLVGEVEGRGIKRDFNQFIEEMNLINLPLLERKFTWIRPNGSSLSRLDSFFVSESWLEHWGDLS